MRRLSIVLAVSLAAGAAWAQGKEPILLREIGSFHVGGRVIEIRGQPIKEIVFTPGGVPAKMDPNGKYQVEQMYVQYFLPQNRKGKLPLLLWHGGGLTGVTYETTPDGRDGWLNYFIRKGWDTYISDAVERGRAGWTDTFKGDALSLPLGDPWERFRIGPPGSWNDDKAKRATYPGAQFPIEAYAQFMKQGLKCLPRCTNAVFSRITDIQSSQENGPGKTMGRCAVKRIDFVRGHQRGHNFRITMIRLSGSQLHAARVLVGLSLDDLAERARLCRHSIRKWETSSHVSQGRCIRTCAERLMCLRVKV